MQKTTKNNPETNPFVHTLEIKARWIVEKEVISGTEGSGDVTLATANPVEVDSWCNVYTEHFLHVVKGMSAAAKDMIFWIISHLGYETDIIEMREDKYCEEMEVSGRTFYKARAELLNRMLAQRVSRRNTYWVNPTYFYRGKRTKAYPQNVTMMNTNPLNQLNGHTV